MKGGIYRSALSTILSAHCLGRLKHHDHVHEIPDSGTEKGIVGSINLELEPLSLRLLPFFVPAIRGNVITLTQATTRYMVVL